ncbi:hypothetical protein [uncultured Marinobacter sp.]|uniref:hypothetical protein n=1 Tax=uncultured Marinobacter sp. TaxID=187379 RepID=UPI0026082282|nr:hypothetical protein [uncultured Marinobacter sp.]
MTKPKSPPQTAIQKANSKVTRHPHRASSHPSPKTNPPSKARKGRTKPKSKKQKAKKGYAYGRLPAKYRRRSRPKIEKTIIHLPYGTTMIHRRQASR